MKFDFNKIKYEYVIVLFIFIIYILTLAPSVVQIDSGELATVQATLGIAHPTGYPLFTLLGHLFLFLPLPFSTIKNLNLLNAIYCALAILLFLKTAKLLTEKYWTGNKNFAFLAGIVTPAILLATNKTFWEQSTSVEVYSLHLFLISLTVYFLIKSYFSNSYKDWIAASVILAFSFTNHMSTLFLLPGFAILFFANNKFSKNTLKTLAKMLIVFISVWLIIYLYLPVRASDNPVMNWGNPVNFKNFFRHITGKQYQVWFFSSAEVAKTQFSRYLSSLPSEFNILALLTAVCGMIASYKISRVLFFFFITNFLFTILYSINYSIHDIDTYFLLSYISIAFFILFGFNELINKFSKAPLAFWISFSLVIIIIQFNLNYQKVNKSDLYTFEDYTKNILDNVENNALIISYQWDYFVSPSYYFRFVENHKKGVAVVDKELLRRSWYYNQLKNNYPEILSGLTFEVNRFLKLVKPFEEDKKFNAAELDQSYRQLIDQLIAENIKKRPVYLSPEMVENELRNGVIKLPPGYTIAPHHYLYKILKANKYDSLHANYTNIRFPKHPDSYTTFVHNIIYSMLANRAIYEMRNGNNTAADSYIKKMKMFDPQKRLPPQLINRNF